jgi:hypothetical protein
MRDQLYSSAFLCIISAPLRLVLVSIFSCRDLASLSLPFRGLEIISYKDHGFPWVTPWLYAIALSRAKNQRAASFR